MLVTADEVVAVELLVLMLGRVQVTLFVGVVQTVAEVVQVVVELLSAVVVPEVVEDVLVVVHDRPLGPLGNFFPGSVLTDCVIEEDVLVVVPEGPYGPLGNPFPGRVLVVDHEVVCEVDVHVHVDVLELLCVVYEPVFVVVENPLGWKEVVLLSVVVVLTLVVVELVEVIGVVVAAVVVAFVVLAVVLH